MNNTCPVWDRNVPWEFVGTSPDELELHPVVRMGKRSFPFTFAPYGPDPEGPTYSLWRTEDKLWHIGDERGEELVECGFSGPIKAIHFAMGYDWKRSH